MQKITLNVADNAIDKVMYLLQNLPEQDVQIVNADVPVLLENSTLKMTVAEKKRIDERLNDIEANSFEGRNYHDVLNDMRVKLSDDSVS